MNATRMYVPLWVRHPIGVRTRWLSTVDHKEIGVLYMAMALGFFVLGGLEAVAIRIQLAQPESRLIDPQAYSQLFTIHGLTMIFLVAIPVLVGFMNYIVPLQIGARDVAFPRLNALSFWLSLFGGILVYFSFVSGGGPDAGWFAYPPLSDRPFSTSAGMDYYIVGLGVNGAGTIVGAINIAVTILLMRCPGLSISRLPLFVWMSLVTSFLILVAYPALSAALVMLFADRRLGAHFFDPAAGGDPLIWQHVFWFFGHPEVYIVILPAFGMISEVIPVFAGKPIFGYRFVAASSVAIGFLSVSVWAHHMFAAGLSEGEDLFFSASSMLIAVPTGVKVLNWTATLYRGRLRFTTAMLWAVGFIATFVLGGLTGVSLAIVPLDWYTTDSYYVVAHMHYVLFGGVVFGVFSGLYYWFPKMTGRLLSERLGRWHFWLTFIGFHVTFLPQHLLGLEGMPRRVFTYGADTGWGPLNLLSTAGVAVMTAGTLVLVWNLFTSVRTGPLAGDDPWDGFTLEWATASPPIPENFLTIPTATSKRPLWDRKHPEAPDER